MKQIYRLPIMGRVLDDTPSLKGDTVDPLCVIPLEKLPGYDALLPEDKECGYVCLTYNVDEGWVEIELEASENYHAWLQSLLPNMKTLVSDKGWRIDKTELKKARAAREAK